MSEPRTTERRRSWWRAYFEFPLIWKLVIALLLGAVVGLAVGPPIEVIEPLGTLFLNLLQMLVVPLILFTLVVGVTSVTLGRLGKIGGKAVLFYLVTSLVAITAGIMIALAVNPGAGLTMPGDGEQPEEAPPLGEVLLDIVPENPVQAMAEGNMLAVVFFAIVIGLALSALYARDDERLRSLAEHMRRFFEAGAEVMFLVVRGVLEYAPIGVFALIAVTLGEVGLEAVAPLARLTGVVYGGVLLMLAFYAALLLLFRTNVVEFFAAAKEAMVTAYVTRSSSGTLPVSIRSAERMGVKEGVYGFTLPFGATVNMDGTALYVGASVIFVANVAGVDLALSQLIAVILVGVLASIGTAGVPGAGLIMLSIAITQAGLPFAAVALVAGIDAILDMARTMCNVTGDLTGTRIIAQTEPEMVEEPVSAPRKPAEATSR
jgi:Na+/H+-dicarboxylate symporter